MNLGIPAQLCLLSLLAVCLRAQQFRPGLAVQLEPGEQFRCAADLDADGDDDLIVWRTGASVATVLTNCRDGSFLRQPAATTWLPTSFAAPTNWATADIDGDGDLDVLAVANPFGCLLLRTDATTLTDVSAQLHLANPGTAVVMRFLDVDGDGDQDLVGVRNPAGTAQYYSLLLANDGHGVFTEVLPCPLPAVPTRVDDMLVADLDGDGARDLVLCPWQGGHLLVWMQRSGGLVDESWRAPPVPALVMRIAGLDHDNDGDVDLVVPAFDPHDTARLLENHGSGVFTDVSTSRLPIASNSLWCVLPIDFDADGNVDLMFYNVAGATLYRNLGGGFAAAPVANWHGDFAAGAIPLQVVDGDGDRYPDLLTTQDLLRNLGGRRLAAWNHQPPFAAVLLADIDGDGDLDAVGPQGTWHNEAGVFRNDYGLGIDRGTAGDVDGDGDVDLVARNGAGCQVLLNDGSGLFGNGVYLNDVDHPQQYALGDIDGDGDLDLASANAATQYPYARQNKLWRNDGAGNFTEVTAAQLPVRFAFGLSVQFADADADGDLDLVIATVSGGPAPVLYLENLGNGTFVDASNLVQPSTALTGDAPRAAFVQLDRDPELELLLSTGADVRLLDRGGGVWQDVTPRHLPVTMPSGRYAFTTLDFDEDGDLDLLVSSNNGTFLLANDGAALFTDVTATRGAGIASAGLAADLDGDGDLDLLTDTQILFNQQRQLGLLLPPRVGQASALEYVAEPGFGARTHMAMIGLSLDRQARPATTPLGTCFLGNGVVYAAMLSNQGSVAFAQLAVPANPVLSGLPLYLQGLDLTLPSGALHLTNLVATRIE